MIVLPVTSYSLCMYVCLVNINKISKGHIGSLGGGDDVVSWIYYFGQGVTLFKLSYYCMKMISLQNFME